MYMKLLALVFFVLMVASCNKSYVIDESFRKAPVIKNEWERSGWIPVHKELPKYPQRAARNDIQGWVLIEYTIQADSSITDINVVDSYPKGIFEKSSIRSVEGFRHKYVGTGEPIKAEGLLNVHHFTLK